MGRNNSVEHTNLINAMMLAIGRRSDLKAIKRHVGQTSDYIRYGRGGEADIEIVLAPRGRVLYLEGKTGKASQSEDQKKFEIYMTALGAQYHVFRSVEQGLEIIKNANR